MDNSNIKIKIYEEIKKLGFCVNHIGTRYIIEAIEIIYNSDDSNSLIRSIEKNVYSKIAKKYNKNPLTIKSNITKATNYVDDMNMIKNRNIKGNNYLQEKLTAKAIINTILLKLGA